MRKVIGTLGFLVLSMGTVRADLTIVADGRSDYVVCVSKDASPSEKWAAEDFVAHVKQMTGVELKSVEGEAPARAIVIRGDDALGEGFRIQAGEERVVISGGHERGAMYGVYTLLEKLGCRWWYPGASTIPQVKMLTVPAMDETQKPALEYRDFLYGEMNDSPEAQLWRARNKVNGGFYKTLPAKYGGAWKSHTLVHSDWELVPPAKYFKEHPEYYALRNGKRVNAQLCYSNEEVVKIAAEKVKELVKAHPEWKFFTVGQEDNREYCTCDGCKALAEKTGSLGGMQLDFGKRVGAIVHATYPEAVINVPAYEWSRQPPTKTAPDDKMSIMLCSIECNFGQPMSEGYPEQNAAFKKDIEGWSKISPRLYMWDYTTNFSDYLLPYPNYYTLIPNIRFYAEHQVRGIMHQGSHTTAHGQLSPLCMFLLAKGMWDPTQDGRKLTAEFCEGYYGPAAGKLVLEYLNLLDAAIQKERTPIWCTRGSFPSSSYLSPELVAKGDALFRQAEEAVREQPEFLKRVETDHVPVLHVMIMRPAEMIPAAQKWTAKFTFNQACHEFARNARAAGITAVREGDTAEPLYRWCDDMSKMGVIPLPAGLKEIARGEHRLVRAAQMDGKVRFLKKVVGASDGWAQEVTGQGWVIQHRMGPRDFEVGKRYKLFVRAKATAVGKDTVLSMGIYHKDGKHACTRNLKPAEVDGNWQTYEIGVWSPAADGGSFYIATGKDGAKEAFLDCFWWVEEK